MPKPRGEPNGKILMRLPRGLHRRLALLAQREGVSLNHLVAALLAEEIGAREAAERAGLERWWWPTATTGERRSAR